MTLGARVLINGTARPGEPDTELVGVVVGKRVYIGRLDEFDVRYLDHCGNPQNAVFQSTEISFTRRNVAENVVDITRSA
jgi:hypothetical protein